MTNMDINFSSSSGVTLTPNTRTAPSLAELAGVPLDNAVESFAVTYPDYSFALTIPELYRIVQESKRLNETDDQTLARIKSSDWMRERSKAQVAWDILKADRPGEAWKSIERQAQNIKALAAQMGVAISVDDYNRMAEKSLAEGWTDQQIKGALIRYPPVSTGATTGQVATGGALGQNQLAAKTLAARYGIRLSDADALSIAKDITENGMDPTALQARFAQQARALYPWMANLLDVGVTPSSYFDPLRQQMARELELPEDAIDISDPKWTDLMQVVDPKTGAKRPASIEEARLNVRKDPRWMMTQNAQDIAARLATGLSRAFGIG